jgi:2-keto-4-pentenoate hydratase
MTWEAAQRERIEAAGRQLAGARAGNKLIAPLDDGLLADAGAAYRVQRAAVAAYGAPEAGWKLGATGAAAQELLRLPGPFRAPLLAPLCLASGSRFALPPGTRGVEVELAFRIGRTLPARSGGYDPEALVAAASSLHPALEIVGCREERDALDGLHAIADFGVNIAFVHGPAIAGWTRLDLAAVTAACRIDGVQRATGAASAVLGSPLLALAWLTRQGVALRDGDWVSTGSLTGITPLRGARKVVGDFGPLGSVELLVDDR